MKSQTRRYLEDKYRKVAYTILVKFRNAKQSQTHDPITENINFLKDFTQKVALPLLANKFKYFRDWENMGYMKTYSSEILQVFAILFEEYDFIGRALKVSNIEINNTSNNTLQKYYDLCDKIVGLGRYKLSYEFFNIEKLQNKDSRKKLSAIRTSKTQASINASLLLGKNYELDQYDDSKEEGNRNTKLTQITHSEDNWRYNAVILANIYNRDLLKVKNQPNNEITRVNEKFLKTFILEFLYPYLTLHFEEFDVWHKNGTFNNNRGFIWAIIGNLFLKNNFLTITKKAKFTKHTEFSDETYLKTFDSILFHIALVMFDYFNSNARVKDTIENGFIGYKEYLPVINTSKSSIKSASMKNSQLSTNTSKGSFNNLKSTLNLESKISPLKKYNLPGPLSTGKLHHTQKKNTSERIPYKGRSTNIKKSHLDKKKNSSRTSFNRPSRQATPVTSLSNKYIINNKGNSFVKLGTSQSRSRVGLSANTNKS